MNKIPFFSTCRWLYCGRTRHSTTCWPALGSTSCPRTRRRVGRRSMERWARFPPHRKIPQTEENDRWIVGVLIHPRMSKVLLAYWRNVKFLIVLLSFYLQTTKGSRSVVMFSVFFFTPRWICSVLFWKHAPSVDLIIKYCVLIFKQFPNAVVGEGSTIFLSLLANLI